MKGLNPMISWDVICCQRNRIVVILVFIHSDLLLVF